MHTPVTTATARKKTVAERIPAAAQRYKMPQEELFYSLKCLSFAVIILLPFFPCLLLLWLQLLLLLVLFKPILSPTLNMYTTMLFDSLLPFSILIYGSLIAIAPVISCLLGQECVAPIRYQVFIANFPSQRFFFLLHFCSFLCCTAYLVPFSSVESS